MTETLASLFEEHVRSALQRAEADFPALRVDSWSEPAYPGQFVIVEDDEGRRSQAEMKDVITRGIPLKPGKLVASCDRLVRAVLEELRGYVGPGAVVVSRPLPDPGREDVHVAHLEFKGLWFRLVVGHDGEGVVAVLSALLGKGASPLSEPDEHVVWL